jgi:tetratricopeptide (TPR) repeat protein
VDFQGALDDFTAALAILESNPPAFYDAEMLAFTRSSYLQNRSILYLQVGDYAAAEADLAQAEALTPDDPGIISQRGELARVTGDYEAALAAYNRVIELDPTNEGYIYNRAETYRLMGNYEAAIADYNQSIQLDRFYTTAYSGRAQTYEAMGDYQAAIASYSEGIEIQPVALLYAGRGGIYRQAGDLDSALNDLNQALALEPDEGLYYSIRGDIYLEQENYEAALVNYNAAIQLDPTLSFYYHDRARAHQFSGNLDEAMADYNRAIELSTPDAIDLHIYYYNRGGLYLNLGDYESALSNYNHALAIQPDYALALYNRAVTYLLRGQGEELAAITDLDQYIRLEPRDPDGYWLRAIGRAIRHKDQRIPASPADLQAILDDYQQAVAWGRSLDADDQSYIAWAQQMLTTTPTPTTTPVTARAARPGSQPGEIALGGGEAWTYRGQAGELVVIRVEAENPAPGDTSTEERLERGLFDAIVLVYGPDGALLAQADIDSTLPQNEAEWNNPRLELTLLVDGMYRIEVRGYADQSAGAYSLVIERGTDGATGTPSATATAT